MILDARQTWNEMWEKIGNFFMTPDDSGVNYLTRILIAIALIVVGWLLIKLIIMLLKKAMGIKKKGPEIDVSAKFFIIQIVKVLLWVGIAFLVISTLKIEVVGIAGITSAVTVALGLALQDLISCFASGLLILQQKHIVTGDFISVQNSYGSCEGTVTKIHFFFTYLKTPAGQEVTVPNNNMIKAVVTNYTRLGTRRLDYDVGVAYNSDIALVKETLLNVIKDDPRVLKDNDVTAYVYELGSYSVGVRLRFWTKFDEYWPVYNELSEKILLAFREKGIYIPSSTDIKVEKK